MARSSERARRLAFVAAALLLSGCFTGHLVAAGRRREYVAEVREVHPLADGGALVHCTTAVTDDVGRPAGTGERWLAVSPDGRATAMPARATPSGPGLPPCSAGPDVGRAPCRTVRPDERGGRLVVRDGARELDVPLQRLTVVRIEPWVYPLWPVAAVIDVLSVPMIVTTGPLIILFGD